MKIPSPTTFADSRRMAEDNGGRPIGTASGVASPWSPEPLAASPQPR
eukprot:CAMPEP_0117535142 /NCGR_PEP_ID=MMETSP0784-20121206/40781_1 /TAXON_ID=39447 /ORGANISM="" /LENGTH=46 /DNA_ID= /DNA_START= /DNA_END= /DNA_ORIENTATION=